MPDSNTTAASPPRAHVHPPHHHHHGFGHHKLTALHNPHLSSFLSSESSESAEVALHNPAAVADVPAPAATAESLAAPASNSAASLEADAPTTVVKRDVAAAPVMQANPIPLVPLCPGRVRHF